MKGKNLFSALIAGLVLFACLGFAGVAVASDSVTINVGVDQHYWTGDLTAVKHKSLHPTLQFESLTGPLVTDTSVKARSAVVMSGPIVKGGDLGPWTLFFFPDGDDPLFYDGCALVSDSYLQAFGFHYEFNCPE